MGGIGVAGRAGAVLAVFAAFAPPVWAANPMGRAFDQGAGNGDGAFTLEDCPVYPSEDRDGQRICTGQVPSFDGTPLDVDVTLADLRAGSGATRPLMVFLNGFGNNKREWMSINDEGDGADKWHWNSHWFAERHGYYVLSYTPRGFDTDKGREQPLCTPPRGAPVPASSYQPCTPGGSSDVKNDEESAIRLKHRDFEIKDTQWLTALAAELVPEADADRVGVSGGSYGGGESWTLASQAEWTFARECSRSNPAQRPPECRSAATPTLDGLLDPPKLQVAVPKYGWTDTAYALAPNGHPGPYPSDFENCDVFQNVADDPCYTSSTGHPETDDGLGNPIGVVKQSYIDVLYLQGQRRSNPPHYKSDETDAWYERARVAGEPYEDADPEIADARRGLTEERASYYQDKQWKAQCGYDPATERCGNGRKVAIFAIGGWTDDLFPAVEVFSQIN
jgi:hypothetical protein